MSEKDPMDDWPWYAKVASMIATISFFLAIWNTELDVLKGGFLIALVFYLFFAIPHWVFLYFRWQAKKKKEEAAALKEAETKAAHEAYKRRVEQVEETKRLEEQATRDAEQAALALEIEREQAVDALAASLKIIKEAVRPIAAGKDNSTMLSLIDEELAKIAGDGDKITAVNADPDAMETLRLTRQILHEKGESDPFIEKYFCKIMPELEKSELMIVKNS